MISFYAYARWYRILLGMMGALGVILQASNIVFSSRRFDWKNYRMRLVFEYIMLLNVIVMAAIPALLNYMIRDGFAPESVFQKERVIAFVLLVMFSLLCLWGGNCQILVNVLVLLPMLPFFESKFEVVPLYLNFVLLYMIVRGTHLCFKNWREVRKNISVWSIKEAMDSLHSGVMFALDDGSILFINKRMQELMHAILRINYRDANEFFKKMKQHAIGEELMPVASDRTVIYSLGRYWHFLRDELQVGRKKYIQFSATDVTRQWNLLCKLKMQNELLNSKSKELSNMLDNMFDIQHEKEKLRLRGKLHDLLSQRITILQRWMQSEDLPTYDQMQDLLQTLQMGLQEDTEKDKESIFHSLIMQFREIGVRIEVSGSLPKEQKLAELFVLCIREATTNAVRHSLATEVFVRFTENDAEYMLEIENNGVEVDKAIQYGNGLRTMQERLRENGGTLQIKTKPRFVLMAKIRKEQKDVSYGYRR